MQRSRLDNRVFRITEGRSTVPSFCLPTTDWKLSGKKPDWLCAPLVFTKTLKPFAAQWTSLLHMKLLQLTDLYILFNAHAAYGAK